ncbi:MAG: hypothetical protein L0229_26120 [Blastocatellia bacterium]|nr:hypothetical protein [Blastocatellia bacterium]
MTEDTAFISTETIDVAQVRKEPRLIAFLFCNYVNVTGNGKPNLLGIFDRIFVDPDKKKTANFIMFVKMAEVSGPTEIRIFNPLGELVAGALLEPNVRQTTSDEIIFAQAIVHISLETEEEGIYWFDILYQGHSLGGTGLEVRFKQREEQNGNHN